MTKIYNSSDDSAIVARDFVNIIRTWLTPTQLAEVAAKNAMNLDADWCATHDYCDANVAMDAAFAARLGRSVRGNDESDCRLWRDAWDIARLTLSGC